jgi:hypothetical protein
MVNSSPALPKNDDLDINPVTRDQQSTSSTPFPTSLTMALAFGMKIATFLIW